MMRKIMLVVGITVLGSSLHAQQAVAAVQAKPVAGITLALRNVTLKEALTQITQQAGLKLVLNQSFAPLSRNVSINLRNATIDIALKEVMRGTGAVAKLAPDGQTIVVEQIRGNPAHTQGVVTGRVTDAKTGKDISGATVSTEVDAKGAITSDDGTFRLTAVPVGLHTISVRLVGYAKQTRQVMIEEGASIRADFKLEPSANVLDQVVVTGTIVQTELRAVPNAITVITAKQIEERGITRIDQLFRGDIPGLFVVNQGGRGALDSVTMFARGATSLEGNPTGTGSSNFTNPIKTYVDGVELANPTYLSQIDPSSIERIEILTGPQASTIYGSNAINGVMQVFTKRGTGTRPRLSITLLSGLIQNGFNSKLTPQHDYSGQLSGTEAKLSYNAGGSWNYIGPWTPAKYTMRTSAFGGARMERRVITVDGSLRYGQTQTRVRGSAIQRITEEQKTGAAFVATASYPQTFGWLNGQTTGATLKVAPTSWWTHTVVYGTDRSGTESITRSRVYNSPSDTLLGVNQSQTKRISLQYTTTLQLPLADWAQLSLTAGGDQWRSLVTTMNASSAALTGTLTGTPTLSRLPNHNAGGFLQGNLGIWDRLFLTYGLRAEWNPNFGDNINPNFAPRMGVAYSRDVGTMSMKLRGSYGRSTRPPASAQKAATYCNAAVSCNSAFIAQFGDNTVSRLANPDLGPEFQQGGEGGLDLYFGSRASLVITRYNQTVDDLIGAPTLVDSIKSLIPTTCIFAGCIQGTDGYAYQSQSQNLNVGSIRNQGWELQGSVNTGPLTTKGTYSWTKTRVIGITPKYRGLFVTSVYQVGRSFNFASEHTWALGMTYNKAATMIALDVNGVGQIYRGSDELSTSLVNRRITLLQVRDRLPTGYRALGRGYATANLNASRRFTPWADGVIQVLNLGDFYQVDNDINYAAIGRQTKFGLRLRTP